jgi:hypothetical protein
VQPAERTHTPRRSRTSTRTAADTERRTRAAERRRRERHFRRRRLDLLQDAGLALVVTIVLISQTAGLGVLALLMVPLAGVLVGSCIAVRARHHRRRRRARHR